MGIKLHNFASHESQTMVLAFNCPGCGYQHAFTVGPTTDCRPRWLWNRSMTAPTFTPSLLCNKDLPENRCHSFVTDGRIQFLADCWHHLKGQTVEIPDWSAE